MSNRNHINRTKVLWYYLAKDVEREDPTYLFVIDSSSIVLTLLSMKHETPISLAFPVDMTKLPNHSDIKSDVTMY